jgi:nicotinamidase-related amidase
VSDSSSDSEVRARLREILSPRNSALLIVDMQRDFCEPGFGAELAGRDIQPARELIPRISELLTTARKCGALVCHVVFDTRPTLTSSEVWIAQRRRSTYSAEDLCLHGSSGAEVISELTPQHDEPLVRKHRYSAFKGTDLLMILRARRIHSCVVVGISTNVCVESTARDAFEHDHHVVIPRDAVASWNHRLHEATLETIGHRFGTVTTSREITDAWQGFAP